MWVFIIYLFPNAIAHHSRVHAHVHNAFLGGLVFNHERPGELPKVDPSACLLEVSVAHLENIHNNIVCILSLSQHDEKHVVPIPLSGIRLGGRRKNIVCIPIENPHKSFELLNASIVKPIIYHHHHQPITVHCWT
jgi:hypothetical protein